MVSSMISRLGRGVLHAPVAHGDAVADADGVKLEGDPPRHPDPGLDRLGDLVEVDVARYELVPGVDDRDEGAVHLLVYEAGALEEGPVGRPLRPDLGDIASHEKNLRRDLSAASLSLPRAEGR